MSAPSYINDWNKSLVFVHRNLGEETKPEKGRQFSELSNPLGKDDCEISIIAVSNLFRHGLPLPRRIFWIICLFISCSLVAYYVNSRLHFILSQPTQMVVILRLNDSLSLPDVTLCPSPIFRKQKLLRMGMTMDGLIGHNFTLGNKFDLPELWRGVAAPSDFIAVSLVSMQSSRKNWKVSYTTLGVCYTHHYPQLIEASGLNFGMQLKLKWDEINEQGSILGESAAGIKVFFHTPNDDILTEMEGIFITPYEDVSIAIRIKEFRSLNRTDHPCIHSSQYSRSKCLNRCFNQVLYDSIQCNLPFMVSHSPRVEQEDQNYCDSPKLYNDSFGKFWNEFRLNVSLWTDCDQKCLIECTKVVYTPFVESVAPSRQNIGKLVMYFPTMSYEIVKEKNAYDIIAFLCDIGGTFGLFLGFSILTVIELLESIFIFSYR